MPGHLGFAGVDGGGLNQSAIGVATGDGRGSLRQHGGLGFLAQTLPEAGIEVVQLLETEAAVEAGGAPGGDEGGFDGEGTAAAEGVLEGLAAVVAGEQEQAGGEVFAQGGGTGILAVAAFEQGFATGVDKDGGMLFADEGVDADVRIGFVYAGALALAAAEAVAQAVFDFEGGKVEAFHAGAFAFHFDFEGLPGMKPVFPTNAFGGAVNVVFAAVGLFGQLQQDAAGGAGVEVGAVGGFEAALAGYAAVGGGDMGAALGV